MSESAGTRCRSQQVPVFRVSRYLMSELADTIVVGVIRNQWSEPAGASGRSQQVLVVGASRHQWSEPAGIRGRSRQVPVVGVSRY